jgi:hypothetical protein
LDKYSLWALNTFSQSVCVLYLQTEAKLQRAAYKFGGLVVRFRPCLNNRKDGHVISRSHLVRNDLSQVHNKHHHPSDDSFQLLLKPPDIGIFLIFNIKFQVTQYKVSNWSHYCDCGYIAYRKKFIAKILTQIHNKFC